MSKPWLHSRVSHIWKITRLGWFVTYEVGWLLLFANIDLIIGKYGSEQTKSLWERWTHPHWGWKSWLIGALAIAIIFLIEGSYRWHSDCEEKSGLKLTETQARLDEEISKRGRPELTLSIQTLGTDPDPPHFMIRLHNSSPNSAVGICMDDIRNGHKVLRFFPSVALTGNGHECVHCQIMPMGLEKRTMFGTYLAKLLTNGQYERELLQST